MCKSNVEGKKCGSCTIGTFGLTDSGKKYQKQTVLGVFTVSPAFLKIRMDAQIAFVSDDPQLAPKQIMSGPR